jgi:Ser/Thr protein kinase RdoA (MazF antagonist)
MTSASEAYVVKMRVGASDEKFCKAVTAHRMVAGALRDVDGLGAPDVLAQSPKHHALLLGYCPGRSAWDVLAASDSEAIHTDTLFRVGRWVCALHSKLARPAVSFEAKRPMRALRRYTDGKDLPDPDGFNKALEQLNDIGQRLNGTPVQQAVIHGDLTLGNLLVDDAGVTGLDFENDMPGPVARDLAMVLTDYSVWFGHDDTAPQGVLLSAPKNRAFWSAYGALGRHDALFGFYMRLRLLRIWAGVPADPLARTVRRSHVWQGVRAARARLFGWVVEIRTARQADQQ